MHSITIIHGMNAASTAQTRACNITQNQFCSRDATQDHGVICANAKYILARKPASFERYKIYMFETEYWLVVDTISVSAALFSKIVIRNLFKS